ALVGNAESRRGVRRQHARNDSGMKAIATQQYLQSRLHTSDATPDLEEVRVLLHRERRGRMIGRHDVDLALLQELPHRLAFSHIADRRRALRSGTDPFHIFVSEEEIVRARFNRNVRAERPRFERRRYPLTGTDMHDVDLRSGLACESRYA